MDELDRILLQEPTVSPSREFTRDVMMAVHREAAAPPPIEFPWHRFLAGVCTNVALLVVIFMLLDSAYESGSGPIDTADLLSALGSPVGYGLTAATGAIFGSIMVLWLALRPARRSVSSL